MNKLSSSARTILSIALLCVGMGFVSASAGARQNDLLVRVGNTANESICIKGKTYNGCCSGGDGVAQITDDALICVNGSQSKTCKGEPEVDLRGCCSGMEGVDYANLDRSIVCKSGEKSPSCSLTRCDSAPGGQ